MLKSKSKSKSNIGILDFEGKNKNPLNDKEYSVEYKKWGQIWSTYPAYQNAKQIIDEINNNQIILLKSDTGSGKTVLIPKFALHSLNYEKKIMIGLPKQIIAKKSAEFAAITLDVKLGEQVGYKYRNSNKKHRSNDTKLLYATHGSIIMKILNDPLLEDYHCIILDEVHERNIQIDLLLYLLKNILRKRKEFKVILMSATVDSKIYENYFKEFNLKNLQLSGKKNFSIESIYLQKDLNVENNQYLEKGVQIIKSIFDSNDEGDILFFVTSVSETKKVCKMLEELGDQHFCIEVYSGIDNETEKLAQDKDYYRTMYQKNRKVVISTNVAESSLTIDNLKYVIDSGLELSVYYDPKFESKIIQKKYTTQSQIKQRMGRTGRTSSGICYHLYTQKLFESLEKYPLPQILTNNLYQECFNLLSMKGISNITDVKNILEEFIQPPQSKYVKRSFEILQKAHLIKRNKLNKIGRIIQGIPIDCLEAITMFYSMQYNCVKEVIVILAMINGCKGQMKDLFYPDDFSKSFYNKFRNKKSDHLSLLNIYQKYDENNNNFRHSTFKKVKENIKIYTRAYKQNLKKYKKNIKIKTNQNCILLSFAFGFNNNISVIKDKNTILYKKFKIKFDKLSYVEPKQNKKILFHNLIKNSTETKANIISILS